MRHSRVSLAAVCSLIALAPPVLAACGPARNEAFAATQTPMSGMTSTATAPPAPQATAQAVILAQFARYGSGVRAITYDPARVPVGSDVAVASVVTSGQTLTLLAVRGLPPNQQFGAHVHMNACGQDPEAAGSHYQHQVDPKQPSVDPAYANPRNEIWLDFTTDAAGSAHAVSTVDWTFDNRPHRSLVIHAEHTHTGPGEAGKAGDRLACVDL